MKVIKIVPSVPKRVLFFAAATVWGFAAYRILLIGFVDVFQNTVTYWENMMISVIGFYFFYKYVFYKMYLKHTKRIINSGLKRMCIFSFFDVKGFMIMVFMITFGITLRRINLIPSLYLGTFYIILGLSLLSAAVNFLYSGVRYKYTKEKFMRYVDRG